MNLLNKILKSIGKLFLSITLFIIIIFSINHITSFKTYYLEPKFKGHQLVSISYSPFIVGFPGKTISKIYIKYPDSNDLIYTGKVYEFIKGDRGIGHSDKSYKLNWDDDNVTLFFTSPHSGGNEKAIIEYWKSIIAF